MKDIFWYIILLAITAGLCAVSLMYGSVDISSMQEADKYILYSIRLPRTIMAMLCGASLAVCGTAYQAVFKNPLSDPYVLGVSSGASFGAAIAIVSGLDALFLGVTSFAFVTSLLTVFIIMRLASVGSKLHTTTLLLAGISINFLFSALISIIMFIDTYDMQKIYFWTMGSLSGVKLSDCIYVMVFSFFGIVTLIIFAKRLNALMLTDEEAISIGINVEKTKRIILIVSTLMCAACVAACGVIGFVGLVVPHIIRLLVGSDNRRIIPFSIFGGMIFMLLADILSRNIAPPAELPIGAITSIIGSLFFIYLLYNAKKKLHF